MEIIRGKRVSFINHSTFTELVRGYDRVSIDLGTGDGRYVRHMAGLHPTTLFIGVDAARDNLYKPSQHAPANALFVIANAALLPQELYGTAVQVTVNFPWGSLLRGLLTPDGEVLAGLQTVACPGARLEVCLNAGALAEAGWELECGTAEVCNLLESSDFKMSGAISLDAHDLSGFPSTWAKRLAFGRDPRAMVLKGVRRTTHSSSPSVEAPGQRSLLIV